MSNRFQIIRRLQKYLSLTKEDISIDEHEDIKINSQSKTVYAYMDGKLLAEYDSITRCGNALGLTRLMVRKAIEHDVILENGLKLSLNKLNN